MRTHGWQGDPPRDDDEARRRIIEALIRCVDRYGARKTGFTQVAEELGVTRATVYRYYRNIDELMKAAGFAAATEFGTRIAAGIGPLADPAETLVEVLARAVEQLPRDPQVGMIFATGRAVGFGPDILSAGALDEMKVFLSRLDIDWAAFGYDDEELAGLAEFFMRLLYSYLSVPEATGDDPRPFLRRWLAPAVLAKAAGSGR
ncbi:TetR/AcrR family transcriptional regulator [Actinomadura darangshiensis]|uniref:TetR/AcrR family transcriptional regulator n=1 Tax=Actinomadura darangshiensis TaxID=705336 RepID=A0A4R5C4J1_9ACTN|nr:TetR/AcrR family transcriptional regulator [Actinomadura darangshiensis]TDD91762.1 TetR/AcrR family transcriptional regulator [Actinomadura darangshiensis]